MKRSARLFCVQWESRRPDSLLRKVARELGLATLTTALRVELLPQQQEQVTPQRRSRSFQVNLALTCCPQRCASKVLRDAEDPCRFGVVGCSAQRTLLFWKLVVSRICSVNVGQSRHRSNAGLALKREFPENEPLLASNELKCACWANVRVELRETWEIMTWGANLLN